MNGVGGERTADGSAEKRAKMRGHRVQGGGKEEDEWRQGGERTADGFAEKRAKMRGVATQWGPEGNEWRIQTHQAYGASRTNAGRPDAHFFFADVDKWCRGYVWSPLQASQAFRT